MSDIFISYDRDDLERVRPLAQALEQRWSVWWDRELHAGANFRRHIAQELESARCVIVVWSSQSIESDWAIDEATEGKEKDCLVPLLLEQVKLPYGFRGIHTEDFTNWKGKAQGEAFERLCRAIEENVGGSADIPQAISRPITVESPEPEKLKEGLLSRVERVLRSATGRGAVEAERPSRPSGAEVEASTSVPVQEPEMVSIPAGTFIMGSESGDYSQKPAHDVVIAAPFAIGRYPVTFDEYACFVDATGRDLPSDEGWGRGRRPIINVTSEDAVAYCEWLSRQAGKAYRLPTEAEWEYAARAGTTTEYFWGDDRDKAGQYAWYEANSGGQTNPVGEKEPNDNGLYDMVGNVWEWVADWWHAGYMGAPTDGSAWLEAGNRDASRRVLRGGSWLDGPKPLRSAFRYDDLRPVGRGNDMGFRVVCRPLGA